MELIGTIKSIEQIRTFRSNFEKQEFIFITEERFPQTLKLEVHSLHIDILDSFNPGDRVIVQLKIFGKEWRASDGQIRYFNSLVAFKMEYI